MLLEKIPVIGKKGNALALDGMGGTARCVNPAEEGIL